MKVIKFGGSSMADAKQLKKVANIVVSDPERRIVVVSAPGKRKDGDEKVTDLLIKTAEARNKGGDYLSALNLVIDRYASIARDLNLGDDIINEITNDLHERASSFASTSYEQFMDKMKAAGEDNSAKLFAVYLKSIGYNANYVNPKDAGMILTKEFGNAQVTPDAYPLLKKNLVGREDIVVFPGFFGYSEDGDIVTFSRGGSDVTGGILAAATEADVYENFTDVDFVYAASPKIVDNPFPIPLFTYEEMRELAYAGFNVLHEEALSPVYRVGIPVNIRNTNNPDAPGTFIVADSKAPKSTFPVVGIAGDTGFITINIYKYMMNREIGYVRRVLSVLEDEGVPFEHMPSGIDDISLIIREKNCSEKKLERIVERIKNDVGANSVSVVGEQAIIMVVGRGMSKHIGIAAKCADALSKTSVNIRMISQGSSETSIMFGVDAKDVKAAVRALYSEFFG